MAPSQFDVRTYNIDAQCTQPDVITVDTYNASCVAQEACTTSANITQCGVSDYRSTVSSAFGKTPYVLIERFSDSHCTKFTSAAAVPLDGRCHGLESRRTFFKAIKLTNSIIVKQMYSCSTTKPTTLEASMVDLKQRACIQNRLLTVVGGDVFSEQTTAPHQGDGNASATTPAVTDRPLSTSGSGSWHTQARAVKRSGVSTSLVTGFVLGAAGIVALVAFWLWRRKQYHKNEDTEKMTNTSTQSAESAVEYAASPSLPAIRLPPKVTAFFARDLDLQSYRRPVVDIRDEHIIGAGGFCVVWRVRLRNSTTAASKRLRDEKPSHDRITQFVEEIKLNAKLTHSRVVAFIGVAWTNDNDLQALFEYMENGTLRSWLHNNQKYKRGKWSEDKLQMAIDVAEALTYTHSFVPPLVHRDLKSSNVLLSIDLRAKLSDFGIARFKSYEDTMTVGVGTTLWLSPEVISGRRDYDQRTDVFAFGVMLSELDTHELPYFDARDEAGDRMVDMVVAHKIADGKLSPSFSPSCPLPVLELAQRCLSFNPLERPSADELLFKIHQIRRLMTSLASGVP